MLASTTGASMRVRDAGGIVTIDEPLTPWLGRIGWIITAPIVLFFAYATFVPPFPTGLVGWLFMLVLITVFSMVALGARWLDRLGSSTLAIDNATKRVAATGPRWTIPADRNARVHAVELVDGRMVRHNDTGSIKRPTWIVRVRVAYDDDEHASDHLDVLQGWPEAKVRAKRDELAELLSLTDAPE